KKQVHYFETAVFKSKLKLSIERNIRDYISDKEDFSFKHTVEQLLAPYIQDEIKKENPNASFEQISRIIGERNMPKESKEPKEELQRPWSPLSSIIVPEESRSSLNEQTISLDDLDINMSQENYEVVNESQEIQYMTEFQYLDPMAELINMVQSNKQFTTDCYNYPNDFDYETQPTEILPFDFSKNDCVDTTLPFHFSETTSIDTTFPLHFIQSTPQDFNDYPFGTVNSDSFLYDTTFDSFESTNEHLYNIFDLTNI
ncbi:19764_t:CDS:2, partial [Racocetra fulgida]